MPINFSLGSYQSHLKLLSPTKDLHQNLISLRQDEYAQVNECLSLISDPLWQNVCEDLLKIMGPASVLKIWKSQLGEFLLGEKTLDFTCETAEAAAFVQQYDFVILGSLQRYFPSLKSLKISC